MFRHLPLKLAAARQLRLLLLFGVSLAFLSTASAAYCRTLAALQIAFGRSLGVLGQGTRWFVFDSGKVRPCSRGRLSVPFAHQVYDYDTPIPGCPQT